MYVIIWEYRIRKGSEKEFEQAYGSGGVWAQFFKWGEGYLRTELLKDKDILERYVTIDYWIAKESYDRFKEKSKLEYESIDRRCKELTENESHVGSFSTEQ